MYKPGKLFEFCEIILFSTFIIVSGGCSVFKEAKSATKNISLATINKIPGIGGNDRQLPRRIAVLNFKNLTRFEDLEIEKLFQDKLIQSLSDNCGDVRLIYPGSPDFPDTLRTPPGLPSEEIDNLALAETGRSMGLNAIIYGNVMSIEITREEGGFLWFRDLEDWLQIQFDVAIIDTETAAKLFARQFIHQVELEPAESDIFNAGRLTLSSTLSEAVDDVSDSLAEDICKAILNMSWSGYVLSVQSDQVIVSFGSDIGVKAGDQFAVYDLGGIIQGVDRYRFMLPGKKIGEILITATDSHRSSAEIVSGEGIKKDSVIKFKEN